MSIQEKIVEKENSVRLLLETIRKTLNAQSKEFQANPNSWNYLTSLAFSEIKLKELVEYFESTPK